MTTVNIYESSRAKFSLRVVKRRKHGRPIGHKRVWVIRDRVVVKGEA